ncbi:CsbD family protein [Salsuginibacillus kocurii]|uniref:CsbD family protein n=1 Tax=Salsuginibacillus kocurii TaxID=427078 RepID=UPI000380D40C|nr:CsbD family protein [Salsuginibacillus kocurii]
MDFADLRSKWDLVTGEAQKKWGKLTDDDLQQIEGDREKLIAKLEERYHLSRAEAEKEIDAWLMDTNL